jgi:hypothetical protein
VLADYVRRIARPAERGQNSTADQTSLRIVSTIFLALKICAAVAAAITALVAAAEVINKLNQGTTSVSGGGSKMPVSSFTRMNAMTIPTAVPIAARQTARSVPLTR